MDYVENRMAEEAAKPTLSPEVQTLFTPLNAILLSLLVLIIYNQFKPRPSPSLPAAPPPVVFKTFTPPTLLPYNGTEGKPIYFAVRGKVFDVTPGANFYGPGGPYANFAGRDASRGLAMGSFDEEMLTKDLEGPLDDLKERPGLGDAGKKLGPEEMEALDGWQGRFEEKYLIVGRLVACGDEDKVVEEKS